VPRRMRTSAPEGECRCRVRTLNKSANTKEQGGRGGQGGGEGTALRGNDRDERGRLSRSPGCRRNQARTHTPPPGKTVAGPGRPGSPKVTEQEPTGTEHTTKDKVNTTGKDKQAKDTMNKNRKKNDQKEKRTAKTHLTDSPTTEHNIGSTIKNKKMEGN